MHLRSLTWLLKISLRSAVKIFLARLIISRLGVDALRLHIPLRPVLRGGIIFPWRLMILLRLGAVVAGLCLNIVVVPSVRWRCILLCRSVYRSSWLCISFRIVIAMLNILLRLNGLTIVYVSVFLRRHVVVMHPDI